jgi:polar amino acid transport system substrate-binding protein
MKARRRSCLGLVVVCLATLLGCATTWEAPNPASTNALAPTGTLRVGLYPGTPTSIIGDPAAGSARGVGFELGQALAARAGLPFRAVVFKNNAELLAAATSGTVDMVFTNATAARSKDLDFSPTVLQVEQGYLVPADSDIRAMAKIDREGVHVGVSEGSTSEGTLSRELRNAAVVRVISIKAAIDLLRARKLDAFATNKATLYEMSDELRGSSVLPGRWGLESFAIGVPKGREAAMPLVSAFVTEAGANGLVARAVEHAGLRGAVLPH